MDGITNLGEYGGGTSPTIANSGVPVIVKIVEIEGDRYIAIEFMRSATAVDVVDTVQISDDLIDWQQNHSGETFTEVYDVKRAVDGLSETVVVRARQPITGESQTFLRVVFEMVGP